MRIGILTTDTAHHRYFIRRLHRELPRGADIAFNVFERKPYPWRRRALRHFRSTFPDLWKGTVLNPYVRWRSQTRAQDAFEKAAFFVDGDSSLPASFPTHDVYSVNDSETRSLLDARSPDLVLIYGTGLVKPEIYGRPRLGSLNAHGGLLPGYRGLDTNLWATWLGRPDDMAVTIHQVEEDFDTGAVVAQRRLRPVPGLGLASLRYYTTVLCTNLFLEAVGGYLEGTVVPRPQCGGSAYYGPMPGYLKWRCDRLLRTFASRGATPRDWEDRAA